MIDFDKYRVEARLIADGSWVLTPAQPSLVVTFEKSTHKFLWWTWTSTLRNVDQKASRLAAVTAAEHYLNDPLYQDVAISGILYPDGDDYVDYEKEIWRNGKWV